MAAVIGDKFFQLETVMATNFANDLSLSEPTARAARLSFEHRFFLTVAVLFPVITVIGFAPSYYFKTLFNTPPLPSLLVHAHGAVMSLWVILFSVQAFLISAKRVRAHMTLGIFSIVLVIAMIVVGLMTGYALLARGGAFPGYTPSVWFMIPVADMIVFPIIYGAAIYYRKKPANHKRLMLVTVLGFLGPSIARLPLPFILDLGTIWFFGVPSLIGVILLAADTYRTGKLNKAFAAGLALLIASWPLRLAIAHTDAWTQFTAWIVR